VVCLVLPPLAYSDSCSSVILTYKGLLDRRSLYRHVSQSPGLPRDYERTTTPMKILIIEDEKKTAAYLRKGLGENGFVIDVASQGEEGLFLARTGDYDLLILDVMLPERDGWSLIAELRRAGKQTPVLFLTARDTVHDRVKGLELGADDYLVKPFAVSPTE